MDAEARAIRSRRSYFMHGQNGDLVDWGTTPVGAPQYGTTSIIITSPSSGSPQRNDWESYPGISPQYTTSYNHIPPTLPPRPYQMPQQQVYLGQPPVIIEEPRPSHNASYNPFAENTFDVEPTPDWRASPITGSLSTLSVSDEYSDTGADSASEENFENPIDLSSPRSMQTAQDQKALQQGRRQRRKAKKKEAQAAKQKKKNAEKKKKNAEKKKKEKENPMRRRAPHAGRSLPPPEDSLMAQRNSQSKCRRMSTRLTRSWSSAHMMDKQSDSIDRHPNASQEESECDPDRYSAVVVKQRRLSGMFVLPRRKSSRKLDTEAFGDLGLNNGGD